MAENLNRCIEANGCSLDFGFIGSLNVPKVLSDYGYAETMFRMATQTTLPSWGYWIEQCGATSLFETWDVMRNIGDASRNHPSMGAVSAWMYNTLGGIRVDPDAPAFRRVLIRPAFVSGLDRVEASYDSQRGEIVSRWNRTGHRIVLAVTIPANVTAEVTLPVVSGISATGACLVKKGTDAGNTVYETGSGNYRFEFEL